jgi:GGDEF-like domain
VRQLLAGGLVNAAELGYELEAWHLGVIGTGMGVGQALRSAAAGLHGQLLCVIHDKESVWVWLGGQRKAVAGDSERLMSARWPASVPLAIGEPRECVDGWRWTHQEAEAGQVSLRP